MELIKYQKEILEAALAGHDTPASCAQQLFGTDKMADADRKEIIAAIHRVQDTVEFNRLYQRAKEDMIGTALDSFKRTLMVNVLEMKDLAKDASDPRVRYSANKDILDRTGLMPTQKTVAYTPSDYERVLEGLRKKEKEFKDGEEPGHRPGPGGVVSPPKLRPTAVPTPDGRGGGSGS